MSKLRTYRLDDSAEAVIRAAHFRKPQKDSFNKVHELIRGLDDDLDRLEPKRLYEQMAEAGYRVDSLPPQLIFNLATGVGKTLLMGALIDYLYLSGQSRNFLVLAPRAAILEKLERESSQHNEKYLLVDPELVTEPALCIRSNLERFRPSEDGLNLFILSPQSISGKDKRFSKPDEFRGESVAEYLTRVDDLVVLVDESHHLGDPSKERAAWTQAIHDLAPRLYFGFTATPRDPAPGVSIVHTYDLAECLRDELYTKGVKLLVKPYDTSLSEDEWDHYTVDYALERLSRKQKAIDALREDRPDFPAIQAVALICASDTAHAERIGKWLRESRGLADEEVLVTHSEKRLTESEIQRLVAIDEPGSPVRVVVNVFQLTEGWDVTNVYVIAPLRQMATFQGALQTLGRGLRLPAGSRVGDPEVDTLDVLCCGKESLQTILDQAIAQFRNVEDADGTPIDIKSKEEADAEEQPIPTVPYAIDIVREVQLAIPRLQLMREVVPLDFDIELHQQIGQVSATAVDLKDLQTIGLAEGFKYNLGDLVRIAAAHTIAEVSALSAFSDTRRVEELIRRFLISAGAEQDSRLTLDPVRLAKYVADQIDQRLRKIDADLVVDTEVDETSICAYKCRVAEGFAGPIDKSELQWSPSCIRVPIKGWAKCVHAAARFDTEGEFLTAMVLDQSKSVDWWARNDPAVVRIPTPIGAFEPDFIFRQTNGRHVALEIKGSVLWSPTDSDARVKSRAAVRWVEKLNGVSEGSWGYALVLDDDVRGVGSVEELIGVAAEASQ
ncbi:MAG: DEAD/DEAH box helicase family protein [Fimbriimonadaceae bacterium]|nr:DEAD/DEAH box helicase family protein [Fimbriimonadaceae bacterium]